MIPLAQHSIEVIQLSMNSETINNFNEDDSSSRNDNFDKTSPLIENEGEDDTDNISETSESQSIDINSTNINNYDPEDSESQSINEANISATNAKSSII